MSFFRNTQNAIFDKHGVHIEHKTIYQMIAVLILAMILIAFLLLRPVKIEYQYDASKDPIVNSSR
jgi:hypothetical protein